MIDVCIQNGFSATIIEREPRIILSDDWKLLPVPEDRFRNYVHRFRGVLMSETKAHSVYWDGEMVCDPIGTKYTFCDLDWDIFIRIE